MKRENSILKFNLNKKVLNPIIKPDENESNNLVEKGTPLELSYPDTNEQDVFFKYTIDDSLPTFFSGIKVLFYYILLYFSYFYCLIIYLFTCIIIFILSYFLFFSMKLIILLK